MVIYLSRAGAMTAGHIIFKISTLPDPVFERQGQDLHMKMRLSLVEVSRDFHI